MTVVREVVSTLFGTPPAGPAVLESIVERLMQPFTMPSSTRCLQYVSVLPPSTLTDGHFLEEAHERVLLRMLTMPASACSLQ